MPGRPCGQDDGPLRPLGQGVPAGDEIHRKGGILARQGTKPDRAIGGIDRPDAVAVPSGGGQQWIGRKEPALRGDVQDDLPAEGVGALPHRRLLEKLGLGQAGAEAEQGYCHTERPSTLLAQNHELIADLQHLPAL